MTVFMVLALVLLVGSIGCSSSSSTGPSDSQSAGRLTIMSQRDTDGDGIIDLADSDDDNDGIDDDMDPDDDNDGINDEDEADSDDDGTIDDHDDDFVELEGRITSISNGEIVVFKRTVIVANDVPVVGDDGQILSLGDLKVGMLVEVYGILNDDGTITAVLIEVEDEMGDDNNVSLEGLEVGDWVQAKGVLDGSAYTLIDIHGTLADDEFEYEGPIQSISSERIVVGGVEFTVDTNTEFIDENGVGFDPGTRVDVHAPVSGVHYADRVRTEDNAETFLKVEATVSAINRLSGTVVVGGVEFKQ